MPKGHQGVIGNAVHVMRIATEEVEEGCVPGNISTQLC
jgi:hypothetical protein